VTENWTRGTDVYFFETTVDDGGNERDHTGRAVSVRISRRRAAREPHLAPELYPRRRALDNLGRARADRPVADPAQASRQRATRSRGRPAEFDRGCRGRASRCGRRRRPRGDPWSRIERGRRGGCRDRLDSVDRRPRPRACLRSRVPARHGWRRDVGIRPGNVLVRTGPDVWDLSAVARHLQRRGLGEHARHGHVFRSIWRHRTRSGGSSS
jgi:hypothetical protein